MNEFFIRFQTVFLSDGHTGMGEGYLSLIDDLQTRDVDDNPTVSFTTWQGVLRSAAEDLAKHEIVSGVGQDVVRQLFGAGGGRAGGRGAGEATIRSLKHQGIGTATQPFVVWTSTAREAFSRSPLDNTLRTIECLSAGNTFSGEIRIVADSQVQVETMLQTLKRVRHVGGGKSRGWGKIRIPPASISSGPLKSHASEFSPPPNSTRPILRVQWQNLERLNLAATGQPGNIVETQTCLSGGRLRGALLHWISRRGKDASHLAQPSALQVTNGYPAPSNHEIQLVNCQACPMPLAIRQPKAGDDSVIRVIGSSDSHQNASEGEASETTAMSQLPWWATSTTAARILGQNGESDVLAGGNIDDERIKGEEYLAWKTYGNDGAVKTRFSPEIAVSMRNQFATARLETTATRDAALFSEVTVREGQDFVSEFVFADAESARRFCEATSPLFADEADERSWLLLGRGRRPIRAEGWEWMGDREIASDKSGDRASIRLTLQSDLIGRSPWLTFVTRPTLEDFARWVEAALPGSELETQGLCIRKQCSEVVDVFGFNAATGLPRAAATALRRGSEFLIQLKNPAKDQQIVARLQKWRATLSTLQREMRGVGERCEDGFGRILIDQTWIAMKDCEGVPSTQAADDSIESNWREAALALVDASMEKLAGLKERPSTTQWQQLRQKVTESPDNAANAVAALQRDCAQRKALKRLEMPLKIIAETISGQTLAGIASRAMVEKNQLVAYYVQQLAIAAVFAEGESL